jgi:hypothetical protein
MQQVSFFGMQNAYAPAGKCSCISGMSAIRGGQKKGSLLAP